MREVSKWFFVLAVCLFVLVGEVTGKMAASESTNWQIQSSLKFDTLCFLNTLTGDPYYLKYYQAEYEIFEPKLTLSVREALQSLKRTVKDNNNTIISAFLCLYFSAVNDVSLDDLLNTLQDSSRMKSNLKTTPYFSEEGWQLYESIRENLRTIFLFLRDVDFTKYWEDNIRPEIEKKVVEIEKDLPGYNVIFEVEQCLGFQLPTNTIGVYMLYYSQPHGIRITGTRYLTDVAWPFKIVLRNAVHEMMHPPYQLKDDSELKKALYLLRKDEFVMDKVLHHNPAYGYNSFEGFMEENCVQAIEQIINEKLDIALDPRQRWKEADEGMHVFAVALYKIMKEEKFCQNKDSFRNFLIKMIEGGKLAPGKIKAIYDSFYSVNPYR